MAAEEQARLAKEPQETEGNTTFSLDPNATVFSPTTLVGRTEKTAEPPSQEAKRKVADEQTAAKAVAKVAKRKIAKEQTAAKEARRKVANEQTAAKAVVKVAKRKIASEEASAKEAKRRVTDEQTATNAVAKEARRKVTDEENAAKAVAKAAAKISEEAKRKVTGKQAELLGFATAILVLVALAVSSQAEPLAVQGDSLLQLDLALPNLVFRVLGMILAIPLGFAMIGRHYAAGGTKFTPTKSTCALAAFFFIASVSASGMTEGVTAQLEGGVRYGESTDLHQNGATENSMDSFGAELVHKLLANTNDDLAKIPKRTEQKKLNPEVRESPLPASKAGKLRKPNDASENTSSGSKKKLNQKAIESSSGKQAMGSKGPARKLLSRAAAKTRTGYDASTEDCAASFTQYNFQCQGASSCTTAADGSADASLANAISGDHATLVVRRWGCRCTGCDPDSEAGGCDLSACAHVEAADSTGSESQNAMVYYEFEAFTTTTVDENNADKTVSKVEELFAAHQSLRTAELNALQSRIPAASKRLGEGSTLKTKTRTSCTDCDKSGADADCNNHCGDWAIPSNCEMLSLNEVDMMVKLYNLMPDIRDGNTDDQGDPIGINNKYMNQGIKGAGGLLGTKMPYINVSDAALLNAPTVSAGQRYMKKDSFAPCSSLREDIVVNNLGRMTQPNGDPLLDVNDCQKKNIDPVSCSNLDNPNSDGCFSALTHAYKLCDDGSASCGLQCNSVPVSGACDSDRDTEPFPIEKVVVGPYNNGGMTDDWKEKFGREGVPCKGKSQSCLSGFNIQQSQACNAVYASLKIAPHQYHDTSDPYASYGYTNTKKAELGRKFPTFRFAFQIMTCSTTDAATGKTVPTITGKAVVSSNSGYHEYVAGEEFPAETKQNGWCPDAEGVAGVTKIDIDTAVRSTLSKVRFLAGELAAQDGRYWRQKLLNRILAFRDQHRATFGFGKTTDCNTEDSTCLWDKPDCNWKNNCDWGTGGRSGQINWWYFNPVSDGGWLSRRYHCENDGQNPHNPHTVDPAALLCGRGDDYKWEADGATCLCEVLLGDGAACDSVTGIVYPQP